MERTSMNYWNRPNGKPLPPLLVMKGSLTRCQVFRENWCAHKVLTSTSALIISFRTALHGFLISSWLYATSLVERLYVGYWCHFKSPKSCRLTENSEISVIQNYFYRGNNTLKVEWKYSIFWGFFTILEISSFQCWNFVKFFIKEEEISNDDTR